MRSMRRWLLATLLGALLVAAGAATALTYLSARAEIDLLMDESLRQVALSLRDHARLDAERIERSGDRPELRLLVQVDDTRGPTTYRSRAEAALPAPSAEGFRDVDNAGREWRVFALRHGVQTIQVAQPIAQRREQAAATALRILWPVLVLLPLLGAAVWWIVGRALRPVEAVARSLRERTPNSLAPVQAEASPQEIAPLVGELNALLRRLDDAFQQQRRFAADAAHELRTPLAALTLQIQLAQRAATDDERARAFGRLEGGVKRATRLVQQLLTLARLDPDAAERPPAPQDLATIAAATLDDLRQLAQEKPVELDLDAAPVPAVAGHEDALRILLANLVDNAIRHSPAGGRVDVAVRPAGDGGVEVVVTDGGPGIPADERARVFDRFYRGRTASGGGSGLGLAIARQVVELHGGRLALGDAPGGPGLRVTVRLPTVAARSGENRSPDSDASEGRTGAS